MPSCAPPRGAARQSASVGVSGAHCGRGGAATAAIATTAATAATAASAALPPPRQPSPRAGTGRRSCAPHRPCASYPTARTDLDRSGAAGHPRRRRRRRWRDRQAGGGQRRHRRENRPARSGGGGAWMAIGWCRRPLRRTAGWTPLGARQRPSAKTATARSSCTPRASCSARRASVLPIGTCAGASASSSSKTTTHGAAARARWSASSIAASAPPTSGRRAQRIGVKKEDATAQPRVDRLCDRGAPCSRRAVQIDPAPRDAPAAWPRCGGAAPAGWGAPPRCGRRGVSATGGPAGGGGGGDGGGDGNDGGGDGNDGGGGRRSAGDAGGEGSGEAGGVVMNWGTTEGAFGSNTSGVFVGTSADAGGSAAGGAAAPWRSRCHRSKSSSVSAETEGVVRARAASQSAGVTRTSARRGAAAAAALFIWGPPVALEGDHRRALAQAPEVSTGESIRARAERSRDRLDGGGATTATTAVTAADGGRDWHTREAVGEHRRPRGGVRWRHIKNVLEAARPQERRVECVGAVRHTEDDDRRRTAASVATAALAPAAAPICDAESASISRRSCESICRPTIPMPPPLPPPSAPARRPKSACSSSSSTMHGACAFARRKRSATARSDAPTLGSISCWMGTANRLRPASLASARTSSVLPVPGGPYRSAPCAPPRPRRATAPG